MHKIQKIPPLRCGIVGFGVMGRCHADVLRDHPYFSLVAIASTTPKPAEAADLRCKWFDSAESMVQSGDVDTIVIATPHWSHARIAALALRAGLNVICEKPLAVTVAQADEVLAAMRESSAALTVVYQSRFEPAYLHAKATLSSGELGPINRCAMVETFWRSEAYFRSRAWRGTWEGEGGGVLINQAQHMIDRYAWLCGKPTSVTGYCDTLLHCTEVEDSATAVMRHPHGWHGQIHANANEYPTTARTVIACDRGNITIHNGEATVTYLKRSIRDHTAEATSFFGDSTGEIKVLTRRVVPRPEILLSRFFENFALALAGMDGLAVSPEDGLNGVEIANAILLSSHERRSVTLPLDRPQYDAFIASKVGASFNGARSGEPDSSPPSEVVGTAPRAASKARMAVRGLARMTLGQIPPPASRLEGPLAIEGGTPVRDTRLRPWAQSSNSLIAWFRGVEPAMRAIFLSGLEGLPQTRQMEFSRKWAEYCSCRHGLMLPHGTDALRIALAAVFDHDGLEYGGELIVPNLSFIASATAPLDRRFGVALVDVDAGTLNIDPAKVEEAIVPGKTRGIVPVHQFGQPADMTALREIARRHGLKIVEDAAQAHGAVWQSGPAGSLGDAAAFSFQSAKNLSCGEGGILTTNDGAVFERAYSLHNAGRTLKDSSRWDHATLGWNCRPTEYQAALLLQRFVHFDDLQAIRERNFVALRDVMADIACLRPLDVHPGVRRHGKYMFVMRYHADRCGNLDLESFLKATGAEGAPIYRCYTSTMSRQLVLDNLRARRPDYVRVLPTPVADKAAGEIVYISASVLLGDTRDMEEIAAAVRKVERHYAGRGAP